MSLKKEHIHPSHDMREEGWYISDVVCQHCRVGVDDEKASRLRLPCPHSPQHGKLL